MTQLTGCFYPPDQSCTRYIHITSVSFYCIVYNGNLTIGKLLQYCYWSIKLFLTNMSQIHGHTQIQTCYCVAIVVFLHGRSKNCEDNKTLSPQKSCICITTVHRKIEALASHMHAHAHTHAYLSCMSIARYRSHGLSKVGDKEHHQ